MVASTRVLPSGDHSRLLDSVSIEAIRLPSVLKSWVVSLLNLTAKVFPSGDQATLKLPSARLDLALKLLISLPSSVFQNRTVSSAAVTSFLASGDQVKLAIWP